ncbi:MAG: lysophospholipid acyltransferase family protein [Bacteroidales bacterium]|nr:lysophospholipid acyltransferase family protein [Bacteroidales bacterium]
MTGRSWAGTTYGNGWMHRHLIRSLRFIPAPAVYIFSYVFIIPVCLIINRESRKAAYSYFRLRMGRGPLGAAWWTYLNHCSFAEAVIDKFAMYAGRKFKVEVAGLDEFNSRAAKPEGFIHLSSHIGNYEIAGYTLVSEHKTINAVVYAWEKASVMENRDNMFSRTNIRMITLKEDMSHLFEIDSALSGGDIVSFPTDRSMGGSKRVECEFLGAKASFPQGPFSVAAMRGLDTLAVNVMKEKWNKYRIYVTPLDYDKQAPRKEQIRQLSEAYVAELEKRLREHPGQWYNFFDFWA